MEGDAALASAPGADLAPEVMAEFLALAYGRQGNHGRGAGPSDARAATEHWPVGPFNSPPYSANIKPMAFPPESPPLSGILHREPTA